MKTSTTQNLWLVLIAVIAGLGTFALTVAAKPQSRTPDADAPMRAALAWAGVPESDQSAIVAHDPAFTEDLAKLRAELAARRSELAAALDDPQTTDQQILARSEAAIAAANAVERRVTSHLLAIRDHLNPDQQRKLFGLCAESVRTGKGNQWRRGQGNGRGRPN